MAINKNEEKNTVEASPSGNNEFHVKGFKNRQHLMNHWKEHGFQYSGFSKEQYAIRALELIQSPVGKDILGHIDRNGVIIRYDKKSNDFVKGKPSKGIFTMFKPNEGIDYYLNQKREDIEYGGKE